LDDRKTDSKASLSNRAEFSLNGLVTITGTRKNKERLRFKESLCKNILMCVLSPIFAFGKEKDSDTNSVGLSLHQRPLLP
jgi:hypothetical protein